jgi:uncharacterized protein YbjT (DUF2867 family)
MIQANTHKPLITVVGAASKQGRSVAHALLDSGRYRVRALTRRRDSQLAQVLAQRGAEVVIVPLQPGMQAELTAAMRGSAGAFLMTPPIVKVPPADHEFILGQELANAAVAAGVEHVVFSGLENVEARTGGTKWAPHFTDKARVEAYIRSLPISSSFVYLAFFLHQHHGILWLNLREEHGEIDFGASSRDNSRQNQQADRPSLHCFLSPP